MEAREVFYESAGVYFLIFADRVSLVRLIVWMIDSLWRVEKIMR